MKFDLYEVVKKDGSKVEGKIAIPETFEELVKLYGKDRLFILGLREYVTKAKKRLVSRRSPKIVLRLQDLSPEVIATLRQIGVLKKN